MPKRVKSSILIIALFVAGLLGFVVASYMQTVLFQLESANKKFYVQSAVNLAEAGAETAVVALNQQDWTGWSVSGIDALLVLAPIDIGNNLTGIVTVKIEDTVFSPIIYSEAIIDLVTGEQLKEQLKIELKTRTFFGNAITATDYVVFYRDTSTTATTYANIDSYDSTLGNYNTTSNRNDNGSVASDLMYSYYPTKNHGMIYGNVATDKTNFPPSVGDDGRVYGINTPPLVDVDSTRISADYKADFPDITPITGTTPYSLSYDDDLAELGSGPTLEKYKVTGDLYIEDGKTLRINGNVAMVVTDDVIIYGKLEVSEPNGQLVMYVQDDFYIRYNKPGLDNQSKNPERVIIYSTATMNGYGTFTLYGDIDIYAAFYGPRVYVNLRKRGSGKLFGALVGREVVIRGNYDFHYDENLKNFAGDSPTYTIDKYQRLMPFEMVALTL